MAFWTGWASKLGSLFAGSQLPGVNGVILTKADGTADLLAGPGDGSIYTTQVDGSGNIVPAGVTAATAQFVKPTDGTSVPTIKPASTASVATDLASVVAINPLTPLSSGQYHITVPSKADLAPGPAEQDRAGNTHIQASAGSCRILNLGVAGLFTPALLPEGPCDAFRVDVDGALIFKQPLLRPFLCVDGSFAQGATYWPNVGNFTADAAHHKHTFTAGSTTPLVQVTATANPNDQILVGRYYAIIYTVTISTGGVTVSLGTTAGTLRSTVGTNTYIEVLSPATNGNISFAPNITGAGSISQVYVIPSTLAIYTGEDHPRRSNLIVGCSLNSAPTVLVTPVTCGVQAVWYRVPGAAELSALLTAAS